jgi:hypothetical protein
LLELYLERFTSSKINGFFILAGRVARNIAMGRFGGAGYGNNCDDGRDDCANGYHGSHENGRDGNGADSYVHLTSLC